MSSRNKIFVSKEVQNKLVENKAVSAINHDSTL